MPTMRFMPFINLFKCVFCRDSLCNNESFARTFRAFNTFIVIQMRFNEYFALILRHYSHTMRPKSHISMAILSHMFGIYHSIIWQSTHRKTIARYQQHTLD